MTSNRLVAPARDQATVRACGALTGENRRSPPAFAAAKCR